MAIFIRTGTIHEVVAISRQIPELTNPHGISEYTERLTGAPHLILVASDDSQLVGFKVGYERDADGSFYSWMGGVLPEYRRHGVAQQLADVQETWAKSQGYTRIRFKTRNRHRAMLLFALKNGFSIVSVEPREELAEYRIVLEKEIGQQ